MNGPRCDRILARMTVAVILAALFNVFARGDDLTVIPTGASPTGQPSTETSSAPTAGASESPAATTDTTPAKPTSPVSAIEQSAVPDPLASLAPADRVVAEKIRDLLAAKSDAIFAGKSERKAVESLYQNRTFAPLWLDGGVPNARATAVIVRLKEADADGLDVSDYRTPNFTGLGPDARHSTPRLRRIRISASRYGMAVSGALTPSCVRLDSPNEWMHLLNAWREAPICSARERAALAWDGSGDQD
jgi:hypothetical protein